jgi:uncharacterized protein YcbK (DUF882 family)
MGTFNMTEIELGRLHELADLQHPHLKGDNHTRTLINKVFNREHLTATEAFDCGKYYQRMLDQLNNFKNDTQLQGEYLHAILTFKWNIR